MDFTQIVNQLQALKAQVAAALAQFDQSVAAAQAQLDAAAAQREVYEAHAERIDAAIAAFQRV